LKRRGDFKLKEDKIAQLEQRLNIQIKISLDVRIDYEVMKKKLKEAIAAAFSKNKEAREAAEAKDVADLGNTAMVRRMSVKINKKVRFLMF
jgi:queuine/archaeosine tRNA-ribosyltransferase